jgi:hypothetical protein
MECIVGSRSGPTETCAEIAEVTDHFDLRVWQVVGHAAGKRRPHINADHLDLARFTVMSAQVI